MYAWNVKIKLNKSRNYHVNLGKMYKNDFKSLNNWSRNIKMSLKMLRKLIIQLRRCLLKYLFKYKIIHKNKLLTKFYVCIVPTVLVEANNISNTRNIRNRIKKGTCYCSIPICFLFWPWPFLMVRFFPLKFGCMFRVYQYIIHNQIKFYIIKHKKLISILLLVFQYFNNFK